MSSNIYTIKAVIVGAMAVWLLILGIFFDVFRSVVL
jgi:hypothetical protein